MYDSIIIGSGPAGLTAAIYLSRSGLKNLLIDGPEPGGQLTTTTEVENFSGFSQGIIGPNLINEMEKQASKFGTKFLPGIVEKIDKMSNFYQITLKNQEVINSKTVILSTGASAKYLYIDGEQENIGRGVSACATCDGFFYRGKEVIVVGGGDTAMEEALHLTKFASKVTIVHRRNVLRASTIMQNRAKKNNKIQWKLNYLPKRILSDEQGVNGIEIVDKKSGKNEILKISGVFVAIGHKPNTKFLNNLVEMDENNYILTKEKSTYTNIPGIFAAGDVQDSKYRQAITAAGSGAMAALDVEEYLFNIGE